MKKILLLIFLPLQIYAQDFTGLWTGFIYTQGNQLPYELVISEADNKLTGYSFTVFTIDGFENTGIKLMKIRRRKGSIVVEDDELIYNNYTTLAKRVILFSTLSLGKEDSTLILQGSFFTRSIDRSSFKGTIRLQKKDNLPEVKIISQLKRMNIWNGLSFVRSRPATKKDETISGVVKAEGSLANDSASGKQEINISSAKVVDKAEAASLPVQKKEIPTDATRPKVKAAPAKVPFTVAADLATRKTEIIRNIFFQSDSLILSLYDNGEIDGDTVSVVINDKIIIANQRLSTSAISTTLYITPALGDSLRLIMYAENLGKIPPNTGVLIIQDGNERHQIRFEGDFKKNSAIILRRKK